MYPDIPILSDGTVYELCFYIEELCFVPVQIKIIPEHLSKVWLWMFPCLPDSSYLWQMSVRTVFGIFVLIIMISITVVTWRKGEYSLIWMWLVGGGASETAIKCKKYAEAMAFYLFILCLVDLHQNPLKR